MLADSQQRPPQLSQALIQQRNYAEANLLGVNRQFNTEYREVAEKHTVFNITLPKWCLERLLLVPTAVLGVRSLEIHWRAFNIACAWMMLDDFINKALHDMPAVKSLRLVCVVAQPYRAFNPDRFTALFKHVEQVSFKVYLEAEGHITYDSTALRQPDWVWSREQGMFEEVGTQDEDASSASPIS